MSSTSKPLNRRSLAAIASLALATPLMLSTGISAQAAPPAPDGWQTVFADDFDGPAGESVDGNN